MHTPVEPVSLRDVERTGRLLAEFAARLDDAFAATLVVKDAFAPPPAPPPAADRGTAVAGKAGAA